MNINYNASIIESEEGDMSSVYLILKRILKTTSGEKRIKTKLI